MAGEFLYERRWRKRRNGTGKSDDMNGTDLRRGVQKKRRKKNERIHLGVYYKMSVRRVKIGNIHNGKERKE